LAGRGTVEVPFWEIADRGGLLGEGLAFGADAVRAVNPDVLGDDRALLVELEVLLELQRTSVGLAEADSAEKPTLAVLEMMIDSAMLTVVRR